MYWNINEILPYQRCFNFINGSRSIGKSYTTQKFCINKCIKNNVQLVYIVRTQSEKNSGVLEKAFSKVILKEFSSYKFSFTNEEILLETKNNVKVVLGYCIAISEAQKIKKSSFPLVKYIIFDEYMLESGNSGRYIGGWKEPDSFLSIYHTIDREEDRVICFLLGNNTSFYNPYHMHPAFSIPAVEKGKIWTSENVLFQWAVADSEMQEYKNNSKFSKMIKNSNYGIYASKGEYIEDIDSFIEKRSSTAKHLFVIEYMGNRFGIWYDSKNGKIYIDRKNDSYCKIVYALTLSDHRENTQLLESKGGLLKWLADNFKNGHVRFVDMAVKKMCESGINLIL